MYKERPWFWIHNEGLYSLCTIMAYEYANVKSQSFWHRKIFQGKRCWLCCTRKKKNDAKTLLIYSQGDKLDIVRGPTVRSHVSVPPQQVVRQSQIWQTSDLQSFVTAQSCSALWCIFVFSLCLMAILKQKTYSGQIIKVRYLSELSSFCCLHTPGMLNAFSGMSVLCVGLLLFSSYF